MLSHILDGLCKLVYPPHCLICNNYLPSFSPAGWLCPRCERTIRYNHPPFCPKCSRHLKNIHQTRCRECRNARLRFDFAWAACLYQDPVKDLLCRFKYNHKPHLADYLTVRMIHFLEIYRLDIKQFDIIIPIPLYLSRLRERGYNQAGLLAKTVSAHWGIPYTEKILNRARNTRPQALLSGKERWTNIQGAFRIMNSSRVSGKNILIIDDLLTTGATASQAAGALKDAGAGTVGILTLAITP